MANITVEGIEKHLNEAQPNWKTEHHEEYEYPLTVSVTSKNGSWVDEEFYDIQMWGPDVEISVEGGTPRQRYRNVRNAKEAAGRLAKFIQKRQPAE